MAPDDQQTSPAVQQPNPATKPSHANGSAPTDNSPFADYFRFRRELTHQFESRIASQIQASFPEPDPLDEQDLAPDEPRGSALKKRFVKRQAHQYAFILAQKAIRALPEAGISSQSLQESLNQAQNQFAAANPWYDSLVPPDNREKISLEITDALAAHSPQELEHLKNTALPAYSSYLNSQIPEKTQVTDSLSQKLQTKGFNPKHSAKIAQKTVDSVSSLSQDHQAEAASSQISSLLQVNTQAVAGKKATQQAQQGLNEVAKASKPDLKQVSKAAGLASNSQEFIKKGYKASKKVKAQLGKFGQLVGKIQLVDNILHPLKFIRAKVLQWLKKQAVNLIIKIIPRAAEVVEAASGLGIPLVIIQEIVAAGLGKLGKTLKGIKSQFKELGKTIKGGLQGQENVILSAGKTFLQGTGLAVDTGLAVAGGSIGAAVGLASGTAVGFLLGSAIPIIGNILGAVIGGIVGAATGAGYGAHAGYKLRKKILRFLAFRFAWNTFWPLLKAILLEKTKLFLIRSARGILNTAFQGAKTIVNFAVDSAKGLVTTALEAPKFILNTVLQSEGFIGEATRGIRSMSLDTVSNTNRFINKLLGRTQNTALNSLSTAENIMLQATSEGPAAALVATPLATVGLVAIITLIIYYVLISSFYSPPTTISPFSLSQSRFFSVVKTADPPGPFANTDLPLEITYTVTIQALEGAISNLFFSNEYWVRQEPQIASEPPTTLPDPPAATLNPGVPYTLTYTVTYNGDYTDAIVCDNFTVSAETIEGLQTSTGVACIVIGDPPDDCPFGWPVLPEGSEPFLRINQGPFAPPTHSRVAAIDVRMRPDDSFDIYPPHAVTARHSGIANFGSGGNYGNFIDIASVCNGVSVTTRYAHLSSRNIPEGPVNLGELIGYTGSSGTNNHHLHYEFRPSGALPMAPVFIPKIVPYGCYDWAPSPARYCNVTIP